MASEERGLRWLWGQVARGLRRLRGRAPQEDPETTDREDVEKLLQTVAPGAAISDCAAIVVSRLGQKIIHRAAMEVRHAQLQHTTSEVQIPHIVWTLDAWMRRREPGDLEDFDPRHGTRVHAVYYEGQNAYATIPQQDPELLKYAKSQGWRAVPAPSGEEGNKRLFLRANEAAELRPGAQRFMAAAAQYLCEELVEIAAQPPVQPPEGKRVVETQHLFEALRNDSELNDCFPFAYLEDCCPLPARAVAGSSEPRLRRLPDAVLGIVCEFSGPAGLGALCRVVQPPVARRVRAFAEPALLAESARRPILEMVSGPNKRRSSASPGCRWPLHILELWERLAREGAPADRPGPGGFPRPGQNPRENAPGIPPDAATADVLRRLRVSSYFHCLYHLPAGVYDEFEDGLHAADAGAEADETVALVSLGGPRRVLFAVAACESNTCAEGCWCTGRYVATVHCCAPRAGAAPALDRVLCFAFGNGELAQEWEAGFWAAPPHAAACAALGVPEDRWGLVVRTVLLLADLRGDGVSMWNALEALHAGGDLTSSTYLSGFQGPQGGAEEALEALEDERDPRFRQLPPGFEPRAQRQLWAHHVGGLDAVAAFPRLACAYPPEHGGGDWDGDGDWTGSHLALRARHAREPWRNAGSPRLVLNATREALDVRVKDNAALEDLPCLCAALADVRDDVTARIVAKHEKEALRRRFSSLTRSSRQ